VSEKIIKVLKKKILAYAKENGSNWKIITNIKENDIDIKPKNHTFYLLELEFLVSLARENNMLFFVSEDVEVGIYGCIHKRIGK